MLIGIDASRAVVAQRTGTENYSLYLIRALLEVGSSHRFRLYFNRAPPDGLFVQDEQVTWRVMPFPRLWTHLRLAWEVMWHPPDVLFVPSHVLPVIHPRRCVATVHDLGYLHHPWAHTRRAAPYLDWSTRFNVRAAARVIVDSRATSDDLVARYGVDPAKIVLAYPAGAEGFAPVTDPRALEAVQQRYGTGQRYFLYVGTLQPRKNLSTLVQAFGSLLAEQAVASDVRLVLAGKPGWLYKGIVQQVHGAGVQGRIVLTGYVPREDLPLLLSGAFAYVLPSWYEGFGLPILEAMACDTPVICSNVSSLPEVAGDAALLFDPRDATALARAMRRVYEDAALSRDLVLRGRERVRAFTWQRCAAQVLGALEAVGVGG
jgi:glycosyltransferase involved in cell wall biosynthesis